MIITLSLLEIAKALIYYLFEVFFSCVCARTRKYFTREFVIEKIKATNTANTEIKKLVLKKLQLIYLSCD